MDCLSNLKGDLDTFVSNNIQYLSIMNKRKIFSDYINSKYRDDREILEDEIDFELEIILSSIQDLDEKSIDFHICNEIKLISQDDKIRMKNLILQNIKLHNDIRY